MSYPQPNSGDPQKDYFTLLNDFVMLWPRLLQADTEHSFVVWFEKLYAIHPPSLILYMHKYKEQFNPQFIRFAEWRTREKFL